MKPGVLAESVSMAEVLFAKASKGDGRGRTGGYLCVADNRGQIVLVCLIGEVSDPQKAEQ